MKVKAKQVSNLKNPWILVDDETGKVLDDAQGYGYRTAQKAHAAYAYRHSNGKNKASKEASKIWWKKHKTDAKTLDQFAFEIAKGSWGSDDKFDYQLFKEYIENNKIDLEGNKPYSLWHYYLKNICFR